MNLLAGLIALGVIFLGFPLLVTLGAFGPEDTMPKEEDYK